MSLGINILGEAHISDLVSLGEQTNSNHAPSSTKPVNTGGAYSIVNPEKLNCWNLIRYLPLNAN